MAKIRVLIVEDNVDEGEELRQSLQELGYDITALTDNLKDALGYFYAQEPDIVLVDIYLHGKADGLVFAEKMNTAASVRRPFIFITSASDRATFDQAMRTQPDSYLIKPFNPLEVQYAIELAIERHYGSEGAFSADKTMAVKGEESMFVKNGSVLYKVLPSDIFYIEVDGKYSQLITREASFWVQWPLKNVIEKLGNDTFIRVHRNFAINWQQIDKVHLKDHQVILKNSKEIPISQNFKEKLISKLEILK